MMLRLVVLTLALAAIVAADALACSCAAGDAEDALAAGEPAFVGVVESRTRVSGTTDGYDAVYDYTVRVQRAYNVDLPERVTARGGGQESACAVNLDVGQRFGTWLERDAQQPFRLGLCTMVDPESLAAATAPPDPLGRGRAVAVVGGPAGLDGTLAALDARGRVVAYGFGPEGPPVAACPGGARFLQATRGGLAVRRTSDLGLVRRVRTPSTIGVACRDRLARHLVIARETHDLTPRNGPALVRIDGDRRRVLLRGRHPYLVPGRRAAVDVAGGEDRERVLVVDYATGAVRDLGPPPASPAFFTFSPDGRRAAFATDGVAGVLDVTDGRLRTGRVHPRAAGAFAFLPAGRLLLAPSGSRAGLLLGPGAEVLSRRAGWNRGTPVVTPRHVLFVGRSGIRRAPLAGGVPERVAPLPTGRLDGIVALPGRPLVSGDRAPRPAVQSSRASQARTSSPCSSRRGGARRTAGR